MFRVTLVTFLIVTLLGPISARADKPVPGKQVELKYVDPNDESLNCEYLLFLPKAYGIDETKKWPVMLFLHGRGESFGPLSLVKKWGPPKLCERDEAFPYILISPQCPGKESWKQERQTKILNGLLTSVLDAARCDVDRVYLTGLSMGGYGSWTLAGANPERFAAVAPVCGGGDVKEAAKLKELPIWVFHGDQDKAVPFSKSVEMVKAIKEAGGTKIKFTSYEEFGHNCWSATYATPGFYQWLDRQVRSSPLNP